VGKETQRCCRKSQERRAREGKNRTRKNKEGL
jgi:hypothetical protein